MPDFNRRKAGLIAETVVADYLDARGFQIIRKNYYVRGCGEIDLIATKNDTMHFIEVKWVNVDTYGDALQKVSRGKVARLTRTAQMFCSQFPGTEFAQLDVVGVSRERGQWHIEHWENVTG